MAGKNEATLLIRIKSLGQEAIKEVADGIESLRNHLLVVAGAVVAFGAAAIAAFKESEEASNQLAQSMVNQGIYTTELKQKYDNMAKSLAGVTTYQDDQITQAQSILQSYIGQREITESLTKATLDLASSKKMDLDSAAQLVGKTIGTETNALSRHGLELNKNMSATQKMAQTIDFINGKWGGQAEQQAKGLGVLLQLKNAVGEFVEAAGQTLAPVVVIVSRELLNLFKNTEVAQVAFNGLKFLFQETAVMINGVVSYLIDMGQGIGSTLGAIAGAASLAAKGQFSDAVKFIKQSNAEIEKQHADNEKAAIERANRIRGSTKEIEEEIAAEELARVKDAEAKKAAVKQEAHVNDMIRLETSRQELAAAQGEKDLAELTAGEAHDAAVLQAHLNFLNAKINAETVASEKLKLIKEKGKTQELLLEQQKNAEIAKNRDAFLSQMASLQNSHNKLMAGIGKAAAIAQIWINTGEAASSGSKWGMAMGGPGLAATFSALAWAAGAAQVARVAGVQLAEGGIVKATPGGIQATIGEGGQDEAVIPLDRAGEFGLGGGGMTINFNGPIMGNESQAQEFAKTIDRELLKLRRSNQSLAFETDVF